MSSLARSRSLRKPTTDPGLKKKSEPSQERPRNVSPSRLPVKGMMPPPSTSSVSSGPRTRAASVAVKSGDGSSGTTTGRSRPISGIFGLGRSASVRQPAQSSSAATGSSTAAATTSRPPITTRSRPIPRPTSASGPSSKLARPSSSSGVPSSSTPGRPAGAGHARTKSSATTLTGATTLRPPSQTSSSTVGTPTSTTGRTTRSATLTSRSTHTRAPSTSSTSTTSTTTAAPVPRKRITPQSEDSSLLDAQRPLHRLPPKPAFSTLQQHYSPAKNLAPKPLTSTFLAPPSPSKLPSNVLISAETARLQTELLQLHLLHRDADAVCAAWRESARQKLGDRFRVVAETEKGVGEMEGSVVERGNVAALTRWGGNELEEKIRLLDVVLSTVWAWNETGGKYARTVRRFERWAEKMVGVVEARGYQLRQGEEMVFVSDLDASWREDCAGLVRKLTEWRAVLLHDLWTEEIRGEDVPSSLDRVLGGLRALVDDMLSELGLMRDIEREAVRQENEWVRAMNRDDDGGGNDTRAGAIWRVL